MEISGRACHKAGPAEEQATRSSHRHRSFPKKKSKNDWDYLSAVTTGATIAIWCAVLVISPVYAGRNLHATEAQMWLIDRRWRAHQEIIHLLQIPNHGT